MFIQKQLSSEVSANHESCVMNDIFQKVAFLFVLTGAIQGCTPPPPPNFEQEFQVRDIDLRKYADQDFLITPSSYGGDFVTVAFITVDAMDGAVRIESKERAPHYSYYWSLRPVTLEQVIDSTVVAAKALGADGLIEFEFSWDKKKQAIQWRHFPDRGPIQLKAWAIRRKQHLSDPQ